MPGCSWADVCMLHQFFLMIPSLKYSVLLPSLSAHHAQAGLYAQAPVPLHMLFCLPWMPCPPPTCTANSCLPCRLPTSRSLCAPLMPCERIRAPFTRPMVVNLILSYKCSHVDFNRLCFLKTQSRLNSLCLSNAQHGGWLREASLWISYCDFLSLEAKVESADRGAFQEGQRINVFLFQISLFLERKIL